MEQSHRLSNAMGVPLFQFNLQKQKNIYIYIYIPSAYDHDLSYWTRLYMAAMRCSMEDCPTGWLWLGFHKDSFLKADSKFHAIRRMHACIFSEFDCFVHRSCFGPWGTMHDGTKTENSKCFLIHPMRHGTRV